MKTITIDEIMKIYKVCGLSGNDSIGIRSQINTGTLNRQLNTGRINNSNIDNKTVLKNSSKKINFRLY